MATELKIKAVIGFSGALISMLYVSVKSHCKCNAGKVPNSLKYTPCGKYIIYALGSFVVIKSLKTDKEAFLDGHSNEVSCLSISHDGTRAASGQVNIIGVKVITYN